MLVRVATFRQYSFQSLVGLSWPLANCRAPFLGYLQISSDVVTK